MFTLILHKTFFYRLHEVDILKRCVMHGNAPINIFPQRGDIMEIRHQIIPALGDGTFFLDLIYLSRTLGKDLWRKGCILSC